MKKFDVVLAGTLAVLGLVGCGGDSSGTGVDAADMRVETMENLPNCTENREGTTALVTEDSSTYKCEEGRWIFMSAPLPTVSTLDDLSNCTAKIDGDTVKVEKESAVYRCDDGEWIKYYTLTDTLATSDALLACVEKREGNTAYITEEHALYKCDDGVWGKIVSYMDTVSTKDALDNCTAKREGDSTYVSKENSVYLCIESAWRYLGTVAANSDELPNCTEKRNNEQAFVVEEHMTLICSESKWYRFDIYTIIEKEEVKSSSSPKQENDWEDYNPVSSSSKVTSSSSVILSSDSKSSSSNTSSTSVQSSSSSKNEAISSSSVSISSSSVILSGGEGTLKDSRDNQVYKTVTIGTQTWMAENLNYAYKGKTSTFDSSSFCYDDDPTNCSKYGRLYLWSAAMDSAGTWSTNGKGCGNGKFCLPTYPVRGVCPEGWHLPTEEDFRILSRGTGATWDERNFYYIDAGKYLKSTSGWNDNGNGTDAYGFSALPAGIGLQGGPFQQLGYVATFWSATRVIESNVDDFYSDDAFVMTLYQNSDHAFLPPQDMYFAASVRCLKD
ncbi:fibrobacter succinogenes major paralogous domain-containing protein [Fibrobacter sp. UWS1]|uniref:fibrobacter succinogenes major paralogous domain-containing protein n=1 Tax=Fibrobacter sp. UWS1 TaxID=1896220 RepID=UPI000BB0FE57|nr:fibrobacter succinogenes major paralogous domain-containing protein [Fibrobacter sp. UWS1]PBC67313.1 uncharacterized protein (TIGR02145 family) [Fibrobacter sp. UWS1]